MTTQRRRFCKHWTKQRDDLQNELVKTNESVPIRSLYVGESWWSTYTRVPTTESWLKSLLTPINNAPLLLLLVCRLTRTVQTSFFNDGLPNFPGYSQHSANERVVYRLRIGLKSSLQTLFKNRLDSLVCEAAIRLKQSTTSWAVRRSPRGLSQG